MSSPFTIISSFLPPFAVIVDKIKNSIGLNIVIYLLL